MKDFKNKGGRPRKEDTEKRTKFIKSSFTTSEYLNINKKAKSLKLSDSAFLRRTAFKSKLKFIDPKFLGEFKRIGVNLNQIAKRINANPVLSTGDKSVLNDLQNQFEELKNELLIFS